MAETEHPGYLLSADRDGRPIVMAVEQFQKLTGETIDSVESFRALYAQYLLWHIPSADADSLAVLSHPPVIAALSVHHPARPENYLGAGFFVVHGNFTKMAAHFVP